ncbi:MAG: c-type cytochrome [Bacteroidota bacterium]
MPKRRSVVILCLLWGVGLLFTACRSYLKEFQTAEEPRLVHRIMPNPQPYAGDPERGFSYMTTGDYISGGVPIQFYEESMATFTDTVLRREGDNAHMTYDNIAFTMPSGTKVVSGSCFTCHATPFLDTVIFGMGNSQLDFQENFSRRFNLAMVFLKRKLGKNSDEWQAFDLYRKMVGGAFTYIHTDNPGVNPAFRLEEGYALHRDPVDFSYEKKKQFEISNFNIASDTPPLWNVKKKDALYYNGMGRGDFTKQLMQAGIQGVPDTTKAREVQQKFADVLAWVEALEPPAYPKEIDQALAAKGKVLFQENCKKCHGTYGENETYPNKIIPMHEIQTDPLYAQFMLKGSYLPTWFNESWYAKSPPYAEQKPSNGYIAPPLDGVWATAPYLHNGSVPTLEALLNSAIRPTYWKRRGDHTDFDFEKVGWAYLEEPDGKDEKTYDTTLPGYSNKGHYFGDELLETERKALIEYVKGL